MLGRLAFGWILTILAVAQVPAQPAGSPSTDALGDPLPTGAIARLGTLRFKHNNPVNMQQVFRGGGGDESTVSQAVFSPNSKRIATVANPGRGIRVWDAATGKELSGPWNSAEETVFAYSMAFSPDGSILAAGGFSASGMGQRSPSILMWDVAAAKLLRTFGAGELREIPMALAFGSDGKTLVSAAGNNNNNRDNVGVVRWWDIESGKEMKRWSPTVDRKQEENVNNPQTIYQATFSLSAAALAVDTLKYKLVENGGYQLDEREMVLYSLDEGKQPGRVLHKAKGKQNGNGLIAFSGDGKRVALQVANGSVEIRDTATGRLVGSPPAEPGTGLNNRSALGLSADGSVLASCDYNLQISVWKQTNPAEFVAFKSRSVLGQVRSGACLAFSPDNKTLLVGVGADIQLYDIATQKELHPWDGHRASVQFIAFTPDGNRVLTATSRGQSGDVKTWDSATWKPTSIDSPQGRQQKNIGVASPDHSVCVGNSPAERLSVYETATGKLLGKLNVPGQQTPQQFGYFSPDNKFYVLQGKAGAKDVHWVFAIPSCKLQCELPGAGDGRNRMYFNPGFSQFDVPRPIVFSGDGRIAALFAANDGRICVVETKTGKQLYRLGNKREEPDQPMVFRGGFEGRNLELSPDGNLMASWNSDDNFIRIWDMRTGKERGRFRREQEFSAVRFAWSPDSRNLAMVKSKREIQVVEAATLRIRREFTGHDGAIFSLAFSPGGQFLVSGSADTTALIWDLRGRSGSAE